VARLQGAWPHRRAGRPASSLQTIGPWGPLPTINTALLLTSGVTLTIAHHALRANHRSGKLILWLFLTVLLGVTFLGVQAYEYMHAYRDLNLKLSSGIFGSTFFMLTGFHGFHVTSARSC
jgi:cytochrome c oxidase subunit 3